jgi:hypothetical protein
MDRPASGGGKGVAAGPSHLTLGGLFRDKVNPCPPFLGQAASHLASISNPVIHYICNYAISRDLFCSFRQCCYGHITLRFSIQCCIYVIMHFLLFPSPRK